MKSIAEKETHISGHRLELLRFRIAAWILARFVNQATLVIQAPESRQPLTVRHGDEKFIMEFSEPGVLWQIIHRPDPLLGDTFMAGQWRLRQGDPGRFMSMLARGRNRLLATFFGRLLNQLMASRRLMFRHDIESSYAHGQHHYDIGNDLYQAFLDPLMCYSCAFFETPDQSLNDAQVNKLRVSLDRLDIQAGMQVLDVGSGWGSMCNYIADQTGAQVTGITVARNQLALAQARAGQLAGNRPLYLLQDYREHAREHLGHYDRIVSIGMLEHVGQENLGVYFNAVADMLKPGGRALIHSIVAPPRSRVRQPHSNWLTSYIFPGGFVPHVDEMVAQAADAGLVLAAEPFIHAPFNYAETLRRWRRNFLANVDKLNTSHYDQRFVRMWIFYLSQCEAMFDGIGFRVAQVLVTRK